MDYEINPINTTISTMDEIREQVRVLLPVLQAARAELGEERANDLILNALRTSRREFFKQVGARLPGSPKEKWDAMNKLAMSRIRENELAFEILKQDSEAFEINFTSCKFAGFFREIGEPDLGAVLMCDSDFQVVDEIASPDVELTRTQTIMQGACCCDFRFRIKSSSIPK
jgi:predicted ArsR family transcriptional regulator